MKKEEKNENKNAISEESKIFESIASEEKISLIVNISNKYIYIEIKSLYLKKRKGPSYFI